MLLFRLLRLTILSGRTRFCFQAARRIGSVPGIFRLIVLVIEFIIISVIESALCIGNIFLLEFILLLRRINLLIWIDFTLPANVWVFVLLLSGCSGIRI